MTRREFGIFIVFVPLIFLAAGCNKKAPATSAGSGTKVSIAGHILNVEVAETAQEQAKGLGGRDFLAENSGMLFLFEAAGMPAFWMKDTRIPLDFIWIKDNKVAEITKDVQPQPNVPDASLRTYQPAELIDSVIEVNAGWTAKNMIKPGDGVTVSLAGQKQY